MFYGLFAQTAILAALATGQAAPGDPPRPCCYRNDRYAGVCTVIPAEKESCASILRYLNSPNTAGRTYCNSTRIRGGWEHVPCPPEQAPARATSPRSTPAAMREDRAARLR